MAHSREREDAIVDPRTNLRSAPPSSPLWCLVDAFEAAANGMANPEAAARLRETEEEAFRPWKALISAVDAFYRGDDGDLRLALDRISPSSPPAALKPLFEAWLAAPGPAVPEILAEATGAAAALFRRVAGDAHPVQVRAEQAEEALRQGMLDRFESEACRVMAGLIESARADGPLLALRYAARCLSLLDEAGEDDAGFFSALLRTLGRADGLAALALALVGRDDRAAAAALRGALSSPDGRSGFLDPEMKAVAAAAARILDGGRPRADKRKEERPAKRRSVPAAPGQLELFPPPEAV